MTPKLTSQMQEKVVDYLTPDHQLEPRRKQTLGAFVNQEVLVP